MPPTEAEVVNELTGYQWLVFVFPCFNFNGTYCPLFISRKDKMDFRKDPN